MKKVVEYKVTGKEWEEAQNKAFEKLNKKAKIDGFRPGHAPKEIFFKKYGKEALYHDAAEIVLEDPKLPQSAAAELKELIATQPFDERRVCNCARNHLLELIHSFLFLNL